MCGSNSPARNCCTKARRLSTLWEREEEVVEEVVEEEEEQEEEGEEGEWCTEVHCLADSLELLLHGVLLSFAVEEPHSHLQP